MSFDHGVFDGGALKTPIGPNLLKIGAARAQDLQQLQGKSLPCTVASVINPWIVTVDLAVDTTPWTIPQLKVPVLAPPYIAYPIQQGDAGLLISADVRLGALTGLGGGTPKITDVPGNLSACAFIWLGNAAWTTLDPDAVVVQGNLVVGTDALAFFAGDKVTQQTVTGAASAITDPNAKAVILSLLAALGDGYNLIDDETT